MTPEYARWVCAMAERFGCTPGEWLAQPAEVIRLLKLEAAGGERN